MNIADTRSIAVVRARLPYIDRRSLSQAWFSALHVASDGTSARVATPVRRDPKTAKMRAPRGAVSRVDVRPMASHIERRALGSSAARSVTGDSAPAASSARGDTRSSARAAAARANNAAADMRSYAPFQTSLTVGVEGARVALTLRRVGSTLHVLALCASGNVELVRRALACADAHLRLRGDSVRSSVRSTGDARA